MNPLNKLVRNNILQLQPYSSARDEFSGEEGIFLDANENPFGTLNRYPDPYQNTLKQKISRLKNINEDQIFIGHGSDEAIDLLFRVFCEPYKDKALCFSPTYGMYKVSAAINAVEIINLPLLKNFEIPYQQLIPYFQDKNLKLLFICNPNNPTGNTFNKETLLAIMQNFKGIVVIDEAYIDFCIQDSFLNDLQKYSRLVILQTLSKAWGKAGIRIGFGFADAAIIKLLNKVKPPYNISSLTQKEAEKTLKDFKTYQKNINTLLLEKEKLIKAFKNIPQVIKIYPSKTNFILAELQEANEVFKQLIAHKVIVRNRTSQVANCIRFTIGTPTENKILVSTLQKIYNKVPISKLNNPIENV